LSCVNLDGDIETTSAPINMMQSAAYGNLNKVTIDADAGLNLEELDIAGIMSAEVKHTDSSSLSTNPDELEDMYLVLHFKLANS
jgi:hypothetical protein